VRSRLTNARLAAFNPIAEGAAIHVALRAVRLIFRALDGYTNDPEGSPILDVTRAHAAMLSHFGVRCLSFRRARVWRTQ